MGWIIGLSLVYFVVWYWLLMRLVKTQDPYPIAGRGWRTRAFWGVTFLFFNPLLSLLYFLFGVLPKDATHPAKRLTATRIICLLLVAMTLLVLEAPIGVPRTQPKQWTQPAPRSGHAEMTLLGNSSAEISASGGYGWFGYHYFDPSHIAIITQGDHPFMIHLGHAVAAHFTHIPAVKSVTFHPNGEGFDEATLMPSLIIELSEKAVTGLPLPAGLILDANIEVSIKSSQYTTSRWTKLPIARMSANSSVHEKFATFGVASPAAKYDRIATTFLNTVGLSFGGLLYPWWKFEPLPPIPDYMYGKGGRAPEHIIPDAAPELHLSGGHMLVHDMALWNFTEGQDLVRLQTRFEQEGWSTKRTNKDYLRMVRDGKQLIFITENGPLEARYINAFTSEEVDQALERLLADPNVETDTLLFFGSYFRKSAREDLFQTYHARIANIAPASFSIAFERALVHEHAGEVDEAKAMLTVARAYERVLTSPQGGWDMDELAEKIGIDTENKTTVDMSLVQSRTINSAVERGEEIVQKTSANQAFRFHIDGEENNPTRYFTARLTDLMWPMTPTADGIQLHGEPLKVITVTGKMFNGATSYYFSVCVERDGLLATQNMNIHLANQSSWTLTATKTADGELEWRLTTPTLY